MQWSKKGAMYGGIGGALGGAILGYLSGSGTKSVGVQTISGTLIVGAIGAGVGAFVPPLMSGSSAPAVTAAPGAGAIPQGQRRPPVVHTQVPYRQVG
jgi:hypothetical protein